MRNHLLVSILLFCFFNLQAQTTVIVESIPAVTPSGAEIYIAGDFQGWDPGDPDYLLSQDSLTGHYSITLAAGLGTISFKFTRGSWPTVEGTATGTFIPNRSLNTSTVDTVILQIEGWEDIPTGGNPGGPQSTAAANVSIIDNSFFIPQLGRNRRIWLYLPPDYDQTNKKYPVLYMHDGQNVFDASTSFAGEWEVDETLNRLHAEGDSGIIVVAIDNGGSNRTREYSAWANATYGGGEGGEYIDFIVETLKPHIDSLYRTKPDRDHTGIMGSSLGGLISTYAAIAYPNIFGKIGAFSPAYWFNPEIFDFVVDEGKQQDFRLYQLVGTLEGSQYVAAMLEMEDSLISAGFVANEIISIEKSDGQHSEWFWAREFESGYKWLFGSPLTSRQALHDKIQLFSIYPNPVKDKIKIAFYYPVDEEVSLLISDMSGKTLHQQKLASGMGSLFQLDLDVKRLKLVEGTYLMTLISKQTTTSKKFMVVK
ncbi:MAG: alpha/beta hydrolase-fold protein [Bacteroidota bacterium]